MRLLRILALLQALLFSAVYATDNGYTDVVTWDNYSLFINDQRVFIFAGEFHYQRLPVPELWLDIFQKFKANGMNTVNVYFFWSYHSPSRGVFDFTSPGKDIQLMLDYAKQAGLYVIARPGPYCNAETSAGGYALWTTDGSGGKYRTYDETYYQAWLPWIQEVGAILEKNQITKGGPVILVQVENEYQETRHVADDPAVLYMEQLKTAFREAGIVVPLIHNEKGMRSQSWSTDYQNVGGAVDIYGLDSYPGGLSCTNPDSGFNLVRTYYQWFQNYSFTQPELIPEFEGGWFQPWGGYFYDDCAAEHDTAFPDVYYKSLLAQRVTILSIYMTFGGTNWGHSAAPVVYTSYDYSAPLRETRQIQDKFAHTKLITLFARSSTDLLQTYMESNGTGNAVNSSAIFTWVLRNPTSGARFYLLENNKSSSRAITNFQLSVNTSVGLIEIPTLQLSGRQSRFVVTDYSIGKHSLLYSSAQVLTYGVFGRHTVVVFYLKEGQIGEFAFGSASRNISYKTHGIESGFTAASASGNSGYVKYSYQQGKGQTVVDFSNGVTAFLLDNSTAYTFFAPPTTSNPHVKPDEQIFVLGPYLVRKAAKKGSTVEVTGDNDDSTTIEVYIGDPEVSTISWNGKSLETKKTEYGSLTANIPGSEERVIKLPELANWKVADSLPEVSATYNDANWIVCNKTTTLSPVKPLTLPVLFSSDYGFYPGIKIYRGYFNGKTATGANITVQGGSAAGWTAWLNGHLVGGSPGNASLAATTVVLGFSNITLSESDNILTIVTDYTGHDQTSVGPAGGENPRGILGATLLSSDNSTFSQWKIQGNAGGNSYIDSVRGPMNEGGLYGERLGWHLPGYDNSEWESGSPLEGLSKSGISWYSTTFDLDIDDDLDVPIGVEFSVPSGTVARIQLFVNGYQYGKYVPHIGPQTRFPIPPGILNVKGTNFISLSLWAQTDAGAKLSEVKLIEYGKYVTDFGFARIDSGRLQPKWDKKRLEYA